MVRVSDCIVLTPSYPHTKEYGDAPTDRTKFQKRRYLHPRKATSSNCTRKFPSGSIQNILHIYKTPFSLRRDGSFQCVESGKSESVPSSPFNLSLDVTSVVALLLAAGAGGGASSVDRGGSRGRGRGGSSSGRGSRRSGVGRGDGAGRGGSSSRGGTSGGRVGGAEGQGRAGDGVAREVGVEVEDDSSIALAVEGGAEGAVGQRGTGASNLQVEALGVVLSTVRV